MTINVIDNAWDCVWEIHVYNIQVCLDRKYKVAERMVFVNHSLWFIQIVIQDIMKLDPTNHSQKVFTLLLNIKGKIKSVADILDI